MKDKELQQYSWKGYAWGVIILHAVGITLLLVSLPANPTLLGLGVLAYTLGLRHAFDADHIAAIDNTVRKLVQQRKNPTGVGFYFSLGHSTVVCIMALITALAAKWAEHNIPQLKEIGGLIGASVSGVFLVLIGILNVFIFVGIYRVFRQMRNKREDDDKLEDLLLNRGLLARFFKPLFAFVGKSWHVYPIGFLFGLGFDTASEVALLAISAGASNSAIPLTSIMSLPILFASGMSLLDTADGVFMTTAYRWAFRTPLRKIYYNLSVTGLSIVAALIIGMIELIQVLTPKLGLTEGFWGWVQELDFGNLGFIMVGTFVLAWLISYGIWKTMRIEERWQA
ncbi:HoxN/HupN/NixA family nickel/cobalt transporter [Paenibacillus albiflavus]|uniref:Nickel/cobalt efflux system n=1 Tax=Paenibacillus albiflavus TaxID=2545760 RepID=A0A4R4EJ42_9BACL|nr:HoxN/HupN/NixA family nickel/cobalt transporter [Paenibacillus albiflavus]TCZ78245.1 HoxN/HupN/NixA family nickel/cobalt transporter [Paenibacillus albiflavus]